MLHVILAILQIFAGAGKFQEIKQFFCDHFFIFVSKGILLLLPFPSLMAVFVIDNLVKCVGPCFIRSAQFVVVTALNLLSCRNVSPDVKCDSSHSLSLCLSRFSFLPPDIQILFVSVDPAFHVRNPRLDKFNAPVIIAPRCLPIAFSHESGLFCIDIAA